MFGIGMPEMILIMAVALIVIGPKKLPDLAKSLGRALGEFKKATRELKDSIDIDDELQSVNASFDSLKKGLEATADDAPASQSPTPSPANDAIYPGDETADGLSEETGPGSSRSPDIPTPSDAEALSPTEKRDDRAKEKNAPVGSTEDD